MSPKPARPRKPTPTAATRIFVLIAPAAGQAVVLRRGPTNHLLMLTWDLQTDRVTPGQWLKGRVYERRCDLSPSGKRFVYFAGNYRPPLRTWTALSHPPYFTALALWPKGDAWGGGGLFESDRVLCLNHGPAELKADPDHRPPSALKVKALGPTSGKGEDEPIYAARLRRDGWELVQAGSASIPDFASKVTWSFDPPRIYKRANPSREHRDLSLHCRTLGVHERGGPWYVQDFELHDGDQVQALGRLDWADWAPTGDLLFARDGRLYRCALSNKGLAKFADAREVADLRPLKFAPKPPPPEALRW